MKKFLVCQVITDGESDNLMKIPVKVFGGNSLEEIRDLVYVSGKEHFLIKEIDLDPQVIQEFMFDILE